MPPRRKRAAVMDAEDSSAGDTEPDTSDSEAAADVKGDGKRSRKSKAKAGKAAVDKIVMWQWKSGGRWVSYSPADSAVLEKGFDKGDDEVVTALSFSKDVKYKFDLKANTQTNPDTGKVREIRRHLLERESSRDKDELGYAALVRSHSKGWTGAAAAPAGKPGKKLVRKASKAEKAAAAKKELADLPPKLSTGQIKMQAALGAQSRRTMKLDYGDAVRKNPHATICFDKMLENEARLCGEWTVMYNSYSFAALIFEVQAAVAAVLFRFKSKFGTLPRLLKKPYNDIPDADVLMAEFPKMKTDHNVRYRSVGICGTTSLLGKDPEAPPKTVFLSGYSCCDVNFKGVLETLLDSCHIPKAQIKKVTKDIIALGEKHGLDVSQFGGKRCSSSLPGHLLQIFMKRHLVDKYAYAALPFGHIDKSRMPLSKTLNGPGPIEGQVRICCNPSIFMRANLVRMFVYSADATFHANREKFQEELTALLEPILGSPETREEAATGIYAGTLPDWYDNADQRNNVKVDNKYK